MKIFADKPILVPVDLSDASDRALEYAMQLAEFPGQIVALHVGAPYVPMDPALMYLVDEEDRRLELESAVREHFAGDAYHDVRIEVKFGDPGYEITALAKDLGVGLIVMPSHGRSGLSHLLIGSVAERVVRHAPCPVLVLRGMKAAASEAT